MIKGQRAWKFTEAMKRRMERETLKFLTAAYPDYEDGEEGYHVDQEDRGKYIWRGVIRGRNFRVIYYKPTRTIKAFWE